MTNDYGANQPSSAGTPLPLDTPAEQLAQIAATSPERWDEIWNHPNCYDGLREWMGAQYAAGVVSHSAQQAAPLSPPPGGSIAPPVEPPGGGVAPSPLPAPRSKKPLAIIAAVVAGVLVLGGAGTALALTGTFDRMFGGTSEGTGDAAAEAAPPFAAGMEQMWTADTDDFVTPLVGEHGQDFSKLTSPYSRASIALYEADMPVATDSAVIFNARGEESRLVVIDAATGETSVDYELGVSSATCVADVFVDHQVFYCVTGDGEDHGTLLRIDPNGDVQEQSFDRSLSRAAVTENRIVVVDIDNRVTALDRSFSQLWASDELENGSFAGIDLSPDRTLIRGMDGWSLLDENGALLAHAETVTPYDNGNGECDARLTPSGKLFVATTDDSCVESRADLAWWSFGENLAQVELFSAAGEDFIYRYSDDEAEVLHFTETETEGEFVNVLGLDADQRFLGAMDGGEPLVVVFDSTSATSYSLLEGEEVASWRVDWAGADAGSNGEFISASGSLLLDNDGTVLTGGAAFDAYSGERLWNLDPGVKLTGAWLSGAGVLRLGGGCPDCSIAGGSYTSSTVTLFSPSGSGGEAVSVPRPGSGDSDEDGDDDADAVSAGAPDFIPACPGDTILLAWMELEDGWIVVCGITEDQPTYVAYQPGSGGEAHYSRGASDPTGKTARGAVIWDPDLQRYIAEMADGSHLTLDYSIGTATVRDSADGSAVREQHRFVRYVFVKMGADERTIAESSKQSGAFDVTAPGETAEEQVRYMVEVLEKSYAGRALVKEALPKLAGCAAGPGGYTDTISAMEAVRDNRAELLAALGAMPVDKIPEGKELLADLTEAIELSYQANVEYVAWARAANESGCATLSAAGKAAADASDAPKDRFAARWNRAVSPQFGVRTFDAWYI